MKRAPAVVGLVGSFVVIPLVVLAGNRWADTTSMCRTVAQVTRHPVGAAVVGAAVGAFAGHGLYEILDEWTQK